MVSSHISQQAPAKAAKLFARNHEILAKPMSFFAGPTRSVTLNHEILLKPASSFAGLTEPFAGNHEILTKSASFLAKLVEPFVENNKILANRAPYVVVEALMEEAVLREDFAETSKHSTSKPGEAHNVLQQISATKASRFERIYESFDKAH